MAKCGKCNVVLTRGPNSTHAQCIKCKLLFHLDCVSLSTDDWSTFKELNKPWICIHCNKELRTTRTDFTPASPIIAKPITSNKEITSLNDVLHAIQMNTTALNAFIENQKAQNADIIKSLDECHACIKENTSSVTSLQTKVDSLLAQVDYLTNEKKILESKVSELHLTVELLKQASRSKTVEIHNIPTTQGENVVELLNKIGTALDVDVSEVDVVYRTRPTATTFDPPRLPPIIVTFLRQSTRDSLIAKRKVKRDFATRHIGWNSQENFTIYINESLTPYFKKLYGAARAAKKSNIVKYVWVKNGKILIRKADGAPVITVHTLNDIPTA